MGLGPTHIILLLVVIVLLFGAGKVSNLMGDVAKGIKSFKKGMTEDDEAEAARKAEAQRRLTAEPRPDLPPEPTRAADPLDRREP
jgi:sec-independent protein translocase protein TatA